jgi:hypothetical protein
MMLSTTFNNISVLSWRSVLLVENTRETHRPDTSHWQTSHILYRAHVAWPGFGHIGDSRSRDRMVYNYLCNQCLSLLTLWARIPVKLRVLDTIYVMFVSDLCQVGGFLWCSPPIKLIATTEHLVYPEQPLEGNFWILNSARKIFHLSTGIFRKYPSQT